MACIIKGQSIQCTQASRDHYLRGKENEKITVCEVSGFATQNADEALSMLELSAKGTKCKKPVYSVKINPETARLWTPDEWKQAIDLLEKNLGLTGHPRVVVEHTKKGRIHRHVLWSRFHPDGGPAKNMGNDYAIHQKTQKEIEKAFQLRPMMVKGRDLKQWEVEWAKRYGFEIFKLRDQITVAFHGVKSGQAFKAVLESKGIVLCRGDKSQFVLILPWGQHKALSSMVMGRPTKAILRRALGDIDIAKLPTVQEGKAQVKANLPKIVPKPKSAKGKSKSGSKSGTSAHTYIRRSKGGTQGSSAIRKRGSSPARYKGLDGHRPVSSRTGSISSNPMQPIYGASRQNPAAIVRPDANTLPTATNYADQTNIRGNGDYGHIASGNSMAPWSVPLFSQFWRQFFSAAKEEIASKQQFMPSRPTGLGNMCLEQLADLEAAIMGKITWAEYNRKWGRGGGPTM